MRIRNELPGYVRRHIEEMREKLRKWPEAARLYGQCFSDCYQYAMERQTDGSVFLYTGDIAAMWNRDSTQQLMPYLPLAKENADMAEIIRGVVRREVRMLLKDSYANSFNLRPEGHHYADTDRPVCGDWTWEQKYEVDTLCWPVRLAYLYWKETGDASLFAENLRNRRNRLWISGYWNSAMRNCPVIRTDGRDVRGTIHL